MQANGLDVGKKRSEKEWKTSILCAINEFVTVMINGYSIVGTIWNNNNNTNGNECDDKSKLWIINCTKSLI